MELSNSAVHGNGQENIVQADPGDISTQSFKDNTGYIYQEAAIYLDMGESNEKFHIFMETSNKIRFMCYLIVHATIYKVVDLIAALVLLLLAMIEPPAMYGMFVPIWVHGFLETASILVLAAVFAIKIKWQGIKYTRSHKRTIAKATLILVMFFEVIIVIIRRDSHVRVTRALRPLFLLDTYYMGGVRRVVREILKSIPPVLDIFALLLFFMVIFAMLGFYFFSTNNKDPNFTTYQRSFISLFVLITTANYPDVMMPAYNHNRAAVFFFVVYIAIALYFFMNLLLASVYSTFTSKSKKKFTRLYLHKWEGATLAFNKLKNVDPDNSENSGIDFPQFRRLFKYYKPRMSALATALIFKHLDQRRSGSLNLKEFRYIYGATRLTWRRVSFGEWFHDSRLPKQIIFVFEKINFLVTRRFRRTVFTYFDIFIYFVIALNGGTVMYEIIRFSGSNPDDRNFYDIHWFMHVFTAIYILEVILKILALGTSAYFDSYWNWFDLLVTLLNLIGSFNKDVAFALYLRPIRLLLLFKLKKSYRVVFDTLRILLSSLVRLAIVIVLFYYSFAIIGMEAFAGIELKSCCRNLSIEEEFEEGGYYYLNNFNNLFRSFVTLFELTVINNWHVIMEGFATVTTEWSRIFFMLFYLSILVVMTIVVAFILDAFVFCIELRKQHRNSEKDTHKVFFQTYLTKEELEQIDPKLVRENEDRVLYVGERFLTRDDLFAEMNKEELEASCVHFDNTLKAQERQLREEPSQGIIFDDSISSELQAIIN